MSGLKIKRKRNTDSNWDWKEVLVSSARGNVQAYSRLSNIREFLLSSTIIYCIYLIIVVHSTFMRCIIRLYDTVTGQRTVCQRNQAVRSRSVIYKCYQLEIQYESERYQNEIRTTNAQYLVCETGGNISCQVWNDLVVCVWIDATFIIICFGPVRLAERKIGKRRPTLLPIFMAQNTWHKARMLYLIFTMMKCDFYY